MTENQMQMRDRLRAFTATCRPDMHEPDNQGIKAAVSGHILDNAAGVDITDGPAVHQCGEFFVHLFNENTGEVERFNLASLIALARMAEQPFSRQIRS